MKKNWSGEEVKIIFKDLDDLCKKEIKFHKESFGELNEEQKAFLKGIEQVKKYLIKQYFNVAIKDLKEGESLTSFTPECSCR